MKQNISHIDELILSFLCGKISSKEEEELKAWIDISPENKAYLQAMREIWLASGSLNNAWRFDANSAYKRFLTKTNSRKGTNRSLFIRYIGRVAAAITLLMIVSYVSFRQGGERLKSRFADIVIEAPLGAKTKMTLPDGTLVWLNAGSKITYSQGFGVDDRDVDLIGEGYFEVARNEELPFRVNTEDLNVRVLGTKFNFSNYPDDEEAMVSLVEGKVQVSSLIENNRKRNLLPDEQIFLNKKTGEMRVQECRAYLSAEWTNGNLFFSDELLPDIVKTLTRSYGVKIRIADASLNSMRFYSDFSHQQQNIEEVLQLLEATNKLTYTIENKEIILHAKK